MSDHPPIAVTELRTFCCPYKHALLAVTAGAPSSDAIELASTLMAGANRLIMNSSDIADDSAVIQHLLETSKSLMDAALTGLWEAEKAAFLASIKPSTAV